VTGGVGPRLLPGTAGGPLSAPAGRVVRGPLFSRRAASGVLSERARRAGRPGGPDGDGVLLARRTGDARGSARRPRRRGDARARAPPVAPRARIEPGLEGRRAGNSGAAWLTGRCRVDLNGYLTQQIIETRLAEARARGDRARLLASLDREPSGPRVLIGRALIQVGRWLARVRSDGGPVPAPTLEGRRP
jgi:hypothetical protein